MMSPKQKLLSILAPIYILMAIIQSIIILGIVLSLFFGIKFFFWYFGIVLFLAWIHDEFF